LEYWYGKHDGVIIATGFLTFIYQYRVTEIISGVKKGIKSIYEKKKQEFYPA